MIYLLRQFNRKHLLHQQHTLLQTPTPGRRIARRQSHALFLLDSSARKQYIELFFRYTIKAWMTTHHNLPYYSETNHVDVASFYVTFTGVLSSANKRIIKIMKAKAKPMYLIQQHEGLRSDAESSSVGVESHRPALYIAGKAGWRATITWYLSRTKTGKRFCRHADVTVVTMSHKAYIMFAWGRAHRYLNDLLCISYLHTFCLKKNVCFLRH